MQERDGLDEFLKMHLIPYWPTMKSHWEAVDEIEVIDYLTLQQTKISGARPGTGNCHYSQKYMHPLLLS